MFLACKNTKAGEHTTGKFVFGQHAFNRIGDDKLWAVFAKISDGAIFFVPHISRIQHILLLFFFGTSELYFIRIDHDNKIPGINMGSVGRFVASTQGIGDLHCKSAQDLSGSINNLPVVGNSFLFGKGSLHRKISEKIENESFMVVRQPNNP